MTKKKKGGSSILMMKNVDKKQFRKKIMPSALFEFFSIRSFRFRQASSHNSLHACRQAYGLMLKFGSSTGAYATVRNYVQPIEQFLRLIVNGGSALSVLNMLEGMTKERQSSFESYDRVLLAWYRNGKTWIYVTDEDEAPIEPMLLEALKQVKDPKLRREIEEALIGKTGKKKSQIKTKIEPSNVFEEKLAELRKLVKES